MTYRTGNHWGVTIVREGQASHTWRQFNVGNTVCAEVGCPYDEIDHPGLVAVVVNGDQALAERICALLNGESELRQALAALVDHDPCQYDHGGKCQAHGQGSDPQCVQARTKALLNGDGCTRVGMHNCAGTWSDHGHAGGRPGPPNMGADASEVMERDATTYEDLAAGQRRFLRHDGSTRFEPWNGDAPSGRASLPVSASGASGVAASTPDGSGAAQIKCDCGHEGLPGKWHSRPCPIAEARAIWRQRCICNDPPPTVDKPKNGTASRPPGWACPRHGAVI